MKVVLTAAGTTSVLAALMLAYLGFWWVSIGLVVPAAALCYALFREQMVLQFGAQLILLSELLLLGSIWPSVATIAALFALPALVLLGLSIVKRRASPKGGFYAPIATLLASICFLWQAVVLARL